MGNYNAMADSVEKGRLAAAPEDQLMVLTANLQQGLSDPTKSNQMRIFANRVSTILPLAPDVLLLQEVSGQTATYVARLLRQRLPFDYRVAIGPSGGVVQSTDAVQEVVWDCAILLNMSTMESLDEGGVLLSTYDPVDGVPGQLVRTKQHSYLLAHKLGRSSPVALVSLHFVQSLRLAPRSIGFFYKNLWIKDIVSFIRNKYPFPTHAHFIGGDLNNPRCLGTPETVKCDEWPFWRRVTKLSGCRDAIFDVHGTTNRALHKQARRGHRTAKPRIDYVFTTTPVLNSSHDVNYGALPGEPGFYSDHRFLWAHLKLPPGVQGE
jgi:endonuclease/exonuclease/phosphatase family metal-dependent hydrolase